MLYFYFPSGRTSESIARGWKFYLFLLFYTSTAEINCVRAKMVVLGIGDGTRFLNFDITTERYSVLCVSLIFIKNTVHYTKKKNNNGSIKADKYNTNNEKKNPRNLSYKKNVTTESYKNFKKFSKKNYRIKKT